MLIEIDDDDLRLIRMLLEKEEGDTRVEIHHAKRSFEYREHLKEREKQIRNLLDRLHLPRTPAEPE
ncbi:MAG: hypothetical protein KA419_10460 [Acidobacteria bacterium]|nr:hypothetical protein [Acidobacteriota bacterium]